MTGVLIPDDRTTKQPPKGFCYNPECREDNLQLRFEFPVDDSGFCCPKCGAFGPPLVGLVTLTHFLASDPQGPIYGQGRRFRMACAAKRGHLATMTNDEAATGDARFVNCPGCLEAIAQQKLGKLQGAALHAKQE